MKTLLTLLASIGFLTLTAKVPGCDTQTRIVGYTQCGTPIIATLEMVRRNRCGEPIFQWVTHYPQERERYSSYRDRDNEVSYRNQYSYDK